MQSALILRKQITTGRLSDRKQNMQSEKEQISLQYLNN